MTQADHAASASGDHWKHNPERSSMFWLKVMTWISLRLGRSASRVVLYGIAAYFLVFASKARFFSRSYLQRALKLNALEDVSWRCLFQHFLSFSSVIHDRVYLINDRYELFDIRVHNQALIDDLVAQGQGLFLIGAHLGSFEVLRAIGRQRPGLRIAMAMYEENAQKINAALKAINPAAQQDIVGLGHINSMIQVHDLLAQGAIVGMLADRSLGTDETCTVDFLGDPASIPVGPFRMAAIMRRPIVFMTGLYRGGNRYDIHFEPLGDFSQLGSRGRSGAVKEAITRYAALMEKYCLHAPYNWFNFFDFWRAPALGTVKTTPDTP